MAREPRFVCGIDWSEHLNDVAVLDRHNAVVARVRIPETPAGVRELLDVLSGLRRSHSHSRKQVPVAIETNKSLLVHALRAKGQPVYQVPPSVVAGRRRRMSPAARKSDKSDAELLAIILREEWGRLRALPDISPQATSVAILTHAQTRVQYTRIRLQAQLRSLLREAHPAAVTAWAGLDHGIQRPEARAVLAAGPTAASAGKLTQHKLSKILASAGRTRLIDGEAYRLRDTFAVPTLRLAPAVEDALAAEIRAQLALFDHACGTSDDLIVQITDTFAAHPHAATYLSFPGCGSLTGARLLAEIGDDPLRFATASGLRAYAGLAPLTWESSTSRLVSHRRICNRRLKTVCHQWAFTSLSRSPGCRSLYDRRRAAGDSYAGALRRVAGRLITGLHYCLTHGRMYHEDALFLPSAGSPAA